MIRPVQTVAPAELPVTLAEAKAHLRVDHDTEDDLISTLVQAAVDHLDGHGGVLGRCLINQTWRVDFWTWQPAFRLPFPDVSSVSSVVYSDVDNAEQTVSAGLYELIEDAQGGLVKMLDDFTEPTLYDDRSDPVRITFVAGYGADADDVPSAIKAAILLMVGHWYQHREAVTAGSTETLPMAVEALITPYRRVGL